MILSPQFDGEVTRCAVIEDEERIWQFQPEAQDFALAGVEASGRDAHIHCESERADVDPVRKLGAALCRFGGDVRRNDDASEEAGQDRELIDPAEADQRASVGYDCCLRQASSVAMSASHSFSVVR